MVHLLRMLPLFLFPFSLFSQPNINFEPQPLSGEDLTQPVDIANAGDNSGRLFILEKRGTIKIILNGTIQSPHFLDIQDQVLNNGERGLLGLVFHPQFPDSAYFYVNYVGSGDTTHISRFLVNPSNPDDALEDSEKSILKLKQPYTNHNAGDLSFGNDGYLYIGLGDGGDGGDPEDRSQDGQTLLGKMLRIDINTSQPYLIPSNNPFTTDPNVLNEIWAIGLRNPWRFSFDALTGDMWIADVGQNIWEEVHIQPASSTGGENYGWDCYEASADFEVTNCANASGNLVFPDFEYPHINEIPDGWDLGFGNSITGGYVYRGSQYPGLNGYYICADYIHNYVWLLRQPTDLLALEIIPYDLSSQISGISTFGESESGELFAASLGGTLYQVKTDEVLAIDGFSFSLENNDQEVMIKWSHQNQTGDEAAYHIERSRDGSQFQEIGKVSSSQATFVFIDPNPYVGQNHYRIKISDLANNVEYSEIQTIYMNTKDLFEANTIVKANDISIFLNKNDHSVQVFLFDLQGRELYSGAIQSPDPGEMISLSHLSLRTGMYVLKVSDGMRIQSMRILVKS